MVSRCALAIEWMSVAWLDLMPLKIEYLLQYLGLGTFLKAMMSSHCRTIFVLISVFFAGVVQLNLGSYLFL